jgi:hypothetical protein
MTAVWFGDGIDTKVEGWLDVPTKRYKDYISTQWKPTFRETLRLLFGGRVHVDSGDLFGDGKLATIAGVVNSEEVSIGG